MQILNIPIRKYFKIREDRIRKLHEKQLETQEYWFNYLVKNGSHTTFGKEHGMSAGMGYENFINSIPLQNYNTLFPYIERIIQGEKHVLWNRKIKWVAKSSGTTEAKSKYIPVSKESLQHNNYLCARDSLTCYCELFPETTLFSGKGITLGGSFQKMDGETKVKCGDVSAILMNSMPALGDFLKAPSRKILLSSNWKKKLKLISLNTVNENITSISGVPSWMLLVLKEVLQIAGKENILEVWPNLQLFCHGGVAFAPYREEYEKIIPGEKLFYMNMYNASEGFFGFQDQKHCDDLLLLTDNGIFYEFAPMDEVGTQSDTAVSLENVKLGQKYALCITTPAGLWRYSLGDTIEFTSLKPYRFKITGRTTHYINAFGEELIVDNADKAISEACRQTGALFKEYTAAPVYLEIGGAKACHEWLIEFSAMPDDIDRFTTVLDTTLKSLNSDYEAKRTGDMILNKPKITVVPKGTFMKWLENRNKLGGQHKVPRLQNDRKIIEEIYSIMN